MNEADFTTCAWCPRLCRHVCPVSVGTGLESATPTAMMTAPLLVEAGVWTRAEGVSATSLCLDCGACESHCKLHIPVSERLSAWRGESVEPEPLSAIEGSSAVVCVVGAEDWSEQWARGEPVARLHSSDELGHAAWRSGAPGVITRLASHLVGRRVVTVSGAVAEVLTAAAVPFERVPPPAGRLFRSCFGGAAPGPSQLACCGRRGGFAQTHPVDAALIAAENVRLLAGPAACDDQGCAEWLRAHGGEVYGPVDNLGSLGR